MRTTGRRISCAALFVLVLLVVPLPAGAYELSGGVSMGGILAGTVPHLAVSPHAGLSWRMESGFLFEVHDQPFQGHFPRDFASNWAVDTCELSTC
jgi:hypothetical protein